MTVSFYDCLRLSVNQYSMRSNTTINHQEHICDFFFSIIVTLIQSQKSSLLFTSRHAQILTSGLRRTTM